MIEMCLVQQLIERISKRQYCIGVIGLGYVGLPLASLACRAGFSVVGFDIDTERVENINSGASVIRHFKNNFLNEARVQSRFEATSDFEQIRECDAILIAVPTPLTKHREPDLSFVESTVSQISSRLRRGHLVVLESTTWPGTTSEVVKCKLDETGLIHGEDYYLAFSPEREDPGNADFTTGNIPKVVGGQDASALMLAVSLYSALVENVVPVSSTQVAEAVKLTENIFRSVNIALVNELKMIFQRMGIDIWEVIEAAKTKPFGFMPFYPGPGLGGHCIPIDPFYLTWKAREFGVTTQFVELAGEINTAMPRYVVDRVAEALDRHSERGLKNAKVLVLGIAYKKNIEDMRESPSLRLIELLQERGAQVDYHDPFIPIVPRTREHASLFGRRSTSIDGASVSGYDVVLIATDHDSVDYKLVVENARLVVDTRNVCARVGAIGANIVKA